MHAHHLSRILIRTAFVLFLAPAVALAQQTTQQPPPQAPPDAAFSPLPPEVEGLTLTPFISAAFAGDLDNSPGTFGAALGYGANERITLEGELAFSPNATQGNLLVVDSSMWSLSGNVLYHFARANSTPYATFGVGVVSANPDTAGLGIEIENTTGFAWNAGVGVKSALNERFGIRGDFRFFNASNAAPDFWRLYGGLVIRRIGQ